MPANHFAPIRSIRAESGAASDFGKGLQRDFLHNCWTCLTHRHSPRYCAYAAAARFSGAAIEQTVRIAETLISSAFSTHPLNLHTRMRD
jgi:hypothetical protein